MLVKTRGSVLSRGCLVQTIEAKLITVDIHLVYNALMTVISEIISSLIWCPCDVDNDHFMNR